ncbi:MAG: 30S ribosomal protein S6 [Mariniblastus sp.]
MAENVYECMFIFNANAYARNPTGAANAVDGMVKSVGGDMLASRLWNEQKLAYPINGHRKGAYWLTYFRMDTSKMVKFNRSCQLNDMILRHLAIKLDPRLVDPMVAVAKGEVPPAPEDSSDDAPAEKPAEAAATTK